MNTRVKMSGEALNNYGDEWEDVVLVVTHTANKYMPASEFFAKGKPQGYHPGYDEGVYPSELYDLKREDTDEPLNFSLYAFELVRA